MAITFIPPLKITLCQSHSGDLFPVAFPLHPETGRPMVDYASEAELRKPVTKIISVTNKSAISTTLEMFVMHFPCAGQSNKIQGKLLRYLISCLYKVLLFTCFQLQVWSRGIFCSKKQEMAFHQKSQTQN